MYDYEIRLDPTCHSYQDTVTSVVVKGEVLLVLNGDHERALVKAAQNSGLEGCIGYVANNMSYLHSSSHDPSYAANIILNKDLQSILAQAKN